ncbi:LysR substrate-binding domain-containing protein [Bradyrhizobium cenepequi]|uniref:LysR substrate-binding domain-containing protein n=1 Tax=Bradyrhizobium cenepequi TaxID=2821403 RepID=UPI001CE33309|nr:LysR substrate-binding domain-containing protein [Bradyrhizobium cenepequi]MCA6112859.1 LysR family transcriptional regulator [Bradyrhizobium cenepequi]
MRKLPILKSLHLFEAVSEFPSFSKAAEALGMTHGAVSYQMRILEDWFGRRLFIRHKSGVWLTSDGERLKRCCASAFAMLEQGCYELRARDAGNSVVVGCSPTFLSHGLLPRIGTFRQAHSDVEFDFKTDADLNALTVGAVDVLFVRGVLKQPHPVGAAHVSNEIIGPVCAPTSPYLMKSPEDILSIPLLHESPKLEAWNEWAKATATCLREPRDIVFDTFSLAIEAAKSGLGLAISPKVLVRSDLEKGELVAPFGFTPVERSIYMFVNEHARNRAAVKEFRCWAIAEILS